MPEAGTLTQKDVLIEETPGSITIPNGKCILAIWGRITMTASQRLTAEGSNSRVRGI